MKCEEIEILLSVYIDGEVTDREKRTIEEHIGDCKTCRMTLADFSELHSLYKELEHVEAPKGFRQRVTQRIEATPKPRFGFSWKLPRLVYSFSFALIIVLCGAVILLHTLQQPPDRAGEELATAEINVYAEDVLFGQIFDQEIDIFSVGEVHVAEEILETIDFDEADTSLFTPDNSFLPAPLYNVNHA